MRRGLGPPCPEVLPEAAPPVGHVGMAAGSSRPALPAPAAASPQRGSVDRLLLRSSLVSPPLRPPSPPPPRRPADLRLRGGMRRAGGGCRGRS